MASTVTKVRFVKCPKCLKVLIEVPDVPVYRCGGCGTILRAKHHKDNGGNTNFGSLESSSNNVPLSDGLSNNELACPKEQKTPLPDVGNGLEQARPPNYLLPDLGAPGESLKKLESSRQGETGKVKSGTLNSTARGQSVETSEARVEQCLNGALENSAKISQGGFHSLSSSKRMQAAAESVIENVGLKEDMSDDTLRSSPKRSSNAYVDYVKKLRAENLDCQSDKLNHASDIIIKADVKKESTSGHEIFARKRITSLQSEAFHSVNSWMEPENNGHSRSFSKDTNLYGGSFRRQNDIPLKKFKYIKHDQMEVLRLVDELRDQLTGLFDQTQKEKTRSHIGTTQQEVQKPLLNSYKSNAQCTQCRKSNFLSHPARACPYNRACACCVCLHCHHVVCCHVAKDPCLCCQTAQTFDHGLEKLQQEDKRKPAKHHCRPVSGGAPFVVCSKCLRVLQLPADFLVSQKVLHKLQCGACAEVLTFSFRARPRKIPLTPTEARHPPSEISASHSNNGRPQGDPVSFTEDERSFDTSSSEAKARRERNGKQVADSSLHRLMGYPSASELLYQFNDDDEEYI